MGRAAALLAALLLLLVASAPNRAFAAGSIVMDGSFEDWEGRAHLADPRDAHHDTYDLENLYWANNPNQDRLYFMIERYEPENHQDQKKEVYYCLFIDTDNNGRFDDANDRVVDITYEPDKSEERGQVTVEVWRGEVRVGRRQGRWGESAEDGGSRAEFYVTFNEIGTGPGYVIRMVLFATDKNHLSEGEFGGRFPASFEEWEEMVEEDWADRLPDEGDLQWAPIPTLPPWAQAALAGLAVALVAAGRARHRRRLGGAA